jgi:hypothetical protein
MPPTEVDADTLLEQLAESGARKDFLAFARLGKSALPSVVRGLEHSSWKVRRDCLRILDHHLDASTGPHVLARLDDPHPDVRKWAAHALGCDHCKSDPELDFAVVPKLMDVAREDPSLRVRRSAGSLVRRYTRLTAADRSHANGSFERQRADRLQPRHPHGRRATAPF